MLLSVIIPIGNLEKDFQNLEKITSKITKSNVEVIFVIDTPEESAVTKLRNLCNQMELSNYQTIESMARNPGGSRNLGISVAKGEWLIFCDSDDQPNFSNMIYEIKKNKEKYDVLVGSYEIESSRHGSVSKKRFDGSINHIWETISLNPGIWRWLIRKVVISEMTFPNLSMGEDQYFILKLLDKNPKIKFSNRIFYTYRLGSTSSLIGSKKNLSDLVKILELEFSLSKFSKKHEKVKNYFIIRQSLTLLKHGNFPDKFRALKFFIILILKVPLVEYFSFMKFTMRLLRG
jgi:glycosyltransferase involved in cell wall biosynthesis